MIRKYKNLIPKVPASCFIFPTAEIIGSVELGEDVIVYPGTVVRAGYGKITIGNKTNLQENVTFHVETGYDIHVGAGVTIGHNAIIHGCTIHDNVLVGMGAIIQEGAVIEENCFIGAGAIVKRGMRIAREEIFGPVTSVIPFSTLDEAIDIVNEPQLEEMGKAIRTGTMADYAARYRDQPLAGKAP